MPRYLKMQDTLIGFVFLIFAIFAENCKNRCFFALWNLAFSKNAIILPLLGSRFSTTLLALRSFILNVLSISRWWFTRLRAGGGRHPPIRVPSAENTFRKAAIRPQSENCLTGLLVEWRTRPRSEIWQTGLLVEWHIRKLSSAQPSFANSPNNKGQGA